MVVSKGNGIDGKSCKFFDERYQGLEVFFDGDMEGVSVFQVDRNYLQSEEVRELDIDVPFKISPTSSMVRSLPGSAGLVAVPMPPSHPQNRIEKTTF